MSLRVASITRVLPTIDDPQSGIFVARRLAAMGKRMDLSVFRPVPYFPLLRPLPGWARATRHDADGLSSQPIPMFYVPKVLKSLDSAWLARACRAPLKRAARERPFDLLDTHFGYPDGVGITRLAGELGMPVVVTIRGVEQDYMAQPDLARQLRDMFSRLTGCICVSHSLRDVALAGGADPSRVTVIHNAIDRDTFRPGNRAAARQRLGLDPADTWLLAVGNLLDVKRHDVLIRSVATLRASHPNLRLAIAGGVTHEADGRTRLESLVAAEGLSEQVRFLGRLGTADVVDWLHAADAFALASRREGCCNALLEALATGLPAVVTRVGDNAHFVTDGVNGALAEPEDIASMTQAMTRLLARQDWDKDRISAGLSVGQWDSVAAKVTDYFSDCCARFKEERRDARETA